MTRKDPYGQRYFVPYFITEGILFVLIQIAQAQWPYAVTGKLMYAAIALTCVMGWLMFVRFRVMPEHPAAAGQDTEPGEAGYDLQSGKCGDHPDTGKSRHPGSAWITAGLSVTACADFFLVLIDRFWIVGVILFCVVQTIYAFSLKRTWKNAVLRLVVFGGVLTGFFLAGILDSEYFFSAISISMLCVNVVTAFLCYSGASSHGMLLFAIGLLLFAGCDISLGLRNLSYGVASAAMLHLISMWLVWIFYLPSQVLILCAGFLKGKKEPVSVSS